MFLFYFLPLWILIVYVFSYSFEVFYVDALATLSAISGAAFAQSSVTISGRLNVGPVSTTTTNTNAAGVVAPSTTARDLTGGENTRTTSRLSFAGVEDLGGGLKAGFDLTYNVGTERATNPALRQANVSLSGGFGTVAMGSFMSNAIDAVRGFNPGNFAAAGGDFQARTHTLAAIGGTGLSGATSNAIAYALPAMGNLKTSIAMVSQSRVTSTATPVTADQKVSTYILGADYTVDALTVKAAYGNAKVNQVVDATGSNVGVLNIAGIADAAGDSAKVNDTAIGASYNLGFAVPYMSYESSKLTAKAGDVTAVAKTTSYELGAKFPMGSLTPFITYGSASMKLDGVKVAKNNAYQLGATYDLSKRTSMYGTYGYDKVKSVEAGDQTAVKRTGYSVGIVHMF